MAVEFHDQQGIGLPDQHVVDRGAIDRDAAAQVDHGAVDQLHRFRVQLHDVARCFHRLAEGGELANAQHLARLDRVQCQLDGGGERQGPLRSHQQACQVCPSGCPSRRSQAVDIVAANPTQLLGEACGDFLRLGGAQGAQALDQIGDMGWHAMAEIIRHRAEPMARAIGQDRIDRGHVVGHQSVADRLRPAGVVARHATDGAPRMGGRIDREEQLVGTHGVVQMPQHKAGFDQRNTGFRVDMQHPAQMLGAIDHQRSVDRLPALAGAAAAR